MSATSLKFRLFGRITYWLGKEPSLDSIPKGDNNGPHLQELNYIILACQRKARYYRLFFYFLSFLASSMNYVMAVIDNMNNRLIAASVAFVIIFFSEMLGWPQYAEKMSSIADSLQEMHDILSSGTELSSIEKIRYYRLLNHAKSSYLYLDKISVFFKKNQDKQVTPSTSINI